MLGPAHTCSYLLRPAHTCSIPLNTLKVYFFRHHVTKIGPNSFIVQGTDKFFRFLESSKTGLSGREDFDEGSTYDKTYDIVTLFQKYFLSSGFLGLPD